MVDEEKYLIILFAGFFVIKYLLKDKNKLKLDPKSEKKKKRKKKKRYKYSILAGKPANIITL